MIIPTDIEKILQQIPGTLYGQALNVMLEQWKSEMNNVKTINTIEELNGRKYALTLVDDLFKFMELKKVENTGKNQYI
jgi:hypothetical protein